MQGLFALLAVGAGLAVAVQGAANAALARSASLGVALVMNMGIAFTGATTVWLATGADTTFFPAGTPWTRYLGGVCGFVIVTATALAFPRLGAALSLALIVLGQTVAALVIDHYGLLGVTRLTATPQRLLGVALVAAGVTVFRL